jgi:hypothetical protein
MRRLCSIAILFLLTTVVPTVAMAGPPTQLYGKSMKISWMEDLEIKSPNGKSHHGVISHAYGLYVSTRGRIFFQSSRVGLKSGRASSLLSTGIGVGSSRDPDGHVIRDNRSSTHPGVDRWQGRTFTHTTEFDSGARRVTVSIDESFRTCSADIVYGREGGVPGVILHGMNAKLHMFQAKISSISCTITDGNMFGDNSE